MHLEFECPVCEKQLIASLNHINAEFTCTGCECRIMVPKPGSPVESFTPGSDVEDSDQSTDSSVPNSKPHLAANEKAHDIGTGVAFVFVGCAQLGYSLFLLLQTLGSGLILGGKLAIFLLLCAFAIVPDGSSELLESPPNPTENVVLPVMILGKVLAIAAIGGGFVICRQPGAGTLAATTVAICAVPLALIHLVNSLVIVGLCYALVAAMSIHFVTRKSRISPSVP